jgi:branched-chain amino acid transport system permease protein
MYGKPHLDQVLFSIGLTFMAVAAVDYVASARSSRTCSCPTGCASASSSAAAPVTLGMGRYRLFIIVVCVALALALQAVLARTRFGSRLRAAVDDPRVAAGLGIPVDRVFLLTFAVGSGLAGLGGALGADMLGLEPTFPLKFMVYFLIVCAVGGTSSITGPLVAALVLGIADVLGKYYVPKLGGFIVYVPDDRHPAVAAAGPVHAWSRR